VVRYRLSFQDALWDIGDIPLGRVSFTGTLQPGLNGEPPGSYTSTLDTTLPPALPGLYRIIVRSDIFNQVYEEAGEANNRTASPDTLSVTVDSLQLGVPLQTTLSTGEERLFQLTADLGQTLRIRLSTDASEAANEVFVRFADVPTGVLFDAASQGPLMANQTVLVPSTRPGEYYILIRGLSEPAAGTPVTIAADVLPLQISEVSPDAGGDGRYVTTTIRGAQFHLDAVVKLVRPGIAEFEPARYEVLDSTRIIATFDFTDAPRGLYDLKVINPDGAEAVVPYLYLVERAIEPDATIGLGGPRVLAPGEVGTYSVVLQSLTNLDTPYAFFNFGVPELGFNEEVFNLKYVAFSSNLRGSPETGSLQDVPFASLDSAVNLDGEILAPGFLFDLAARDFASRTFNAHVYPGLQEIIDGVFDALVEKIEALYPELRGILEQPEDLDQIHPGLFDIFQSKGNPLATIADEDIAFKFHIVASATSLTRAEFIARQSAEALRLRDGILSDDTASQALVVLAADKDLWVSLYLAALEEAGLLRPEEQAPAVRESPKVASLMSVLASGILVGPAGEEIITDGDLIGFFEDLRRWYGHDPNEIGDRVLPAREDFDLGLSSPTHFEAFEIFVPYGVVRLDEPGLVDAAPPDFSSLFDDAGPPSPLVSLSGPLGSGPEQFLPMGQRLPFTIRFQNSADAPSAVSEVRIVTELDPDLDPRSFRLGDLRLGDIEVHIPGDRAFFQGEFDFTEAKGFILRITAGLDLLSSTATWLLQAIDPRTGVLLDAPGIGLLPPNNAQGAGSGFVTYTVLPREDVETRTEISAGARVLFNTTPPQVTGTVTRLMDAVAPFTSITATPPGPGRQRLPASMDGPRRRRRLRRQARDRLCGRRRRGLRDFPAADHRDLGHLHRRGRTGLRVPGPGHG